MLWIAAAGVVAPAWLQLLGVDASVPTLTVDRLLTHVTWGVSLGLLTALGYRHLTPRLARWLA